MCILNGYRGESEWIVWFFFCESMKTDNRHFNTNMTQSNPTVQRPQVNMIGQLQDEHILQISSYRALLLWAIPATHKLTGSIWNVVRCSWYGHHFSLENLKPTQLLTIEQTDWFLLSPVFFLNTSSTSLSSYSWSRPFSPRLYLGRTLIMSVCSCVVFMSCDLASSPPPLSQTHVYSIAISFESKYSLVLSDVCVQYFL